MSGMNVKLITAYDLLPSPARVERPQRAPFRVGLVQERWHPDPAEHRAALAGGVRVAATEGARLVCGGQRLGGDYAGGFYLPLTILADVDQSSSLAQEEVFGPVLAVTSFDSEDEAIAIANGTEFGLGAYIHTQNLARAHSVAAQMDAGMVQVNDSGAGMTPCVPFGGMKQSGYGRLGGEDGLHEFLQAKNVWVNLAAEG